MTKQTETTKTYSSLGRGEEFLKNLINEMTRELPSAERYRFTDRVEGKGA